MVQVRLPCRALHVAVPIETLQRNATRYRHETRPFQNVACNGSATVCNVTVAMDGHKCVPTGKPKIQGVTPWA